MVAHSAELVTAARSLAVWAVIAGWSATFLTESARLVRSTLTRPPSDWLTAPAVDVTRVPITWAATQLTLPLALVSVFVLISHFAQTGWLWSPHRTLPDVSRLSPLTGLGRIASATMARTTVLLAKSLLFLSLTAWLLASEWNKPAPTVPQSDVTSADAMDWSNLQKPVRRITLITSLSLLAWGLLDYVMQRRRFEQSLRMTKSEVLRELKETSRRAAHRQTVAHNR